MIRLPVTRLTRTWATLVVTGAVISLVACTTPATRDDGTTPPGTGPEGSSDPSTDASTVSPSPGASTDPSPSARTTPESPNAPPTEAPAVTEEAPAPSEPRDGAEASPMQGEDSGIKRYTRATLPASCRDLVEALFPCDYYRQSGAMAMAQECQQEKIEQSDCPIPLETVRDAMARNGDS